MAHDCARGGRETPPHVNTSTTPTGPQSIDPPLISWNTLNAIELTVRAGLEMLSLGSILYVTLLLINAMAVLSEDRFLARSALSLPLCEHTELTLSFSLCSWLGVDTAPSWAGRVWSSICAAIRSADTGHWYEGAAHKLDKCSANVDAK